MTSESEKFSSEGAWIMLEAACHLVSREQIAMWCQDGLVSCRAGLRVTQIRDLDTGTNETISEENIILDATDWASNALGNLDGPHWQGESARFEFGENSGFPFGLNMMILGGTLYRIQVHQGDLDRWLAKMPPKARPGRPKGRGGYKHSDGPIVEKMRAGLQSGEFKSAYAAGLHFANEAEGPITEASSKAKRLADRLKLSEKSGRN